MRGASVSSGWNSDFSEMIASHQNWLKKHGQNQNSVIFREIEYQIDLLNCDQTNLTDHISTTTVKYNSHKQQDRNMHMYLF